MKLTTREEESAVVIAVAGRIDATTAPMLEQCVEESMGENRNILVLNMAELGYISSAGLRVVLQAAKDLKARQGDLLLAGLQGSVKDIFEMSGFLSIFKSFDTEEAALEQA